MRLKNKKKNGLSRVQHPKKKKKLHHELAKS
jgi:hypothetical protein